MKHLHFSPNASLDKGEAQVLKGQQMALDVYNAVLQGEGSLGARRSFLIHCSVPLKLSKR